MTGRSNGNNDEALYTYDLQTDTMTKITPVLSRVPNPNVVYYQACYSRNPAFSDKIVGRRVVGGTQELFNADDDGSNLQVVANPLGGGTANSPSLTRDGLGLFFHTFNSERGIVRADLDMGSATASNPQTVVSYGNVQQAFAW